MKFIEIKIKYQNNELMFREKLHLRLINNMSCQNGFHVHADRYHNISSHGVRTVKVIK